MRDFCSATGRIQIPTPQHAGMHIATRDDDTCSATRDASCLRTNKWYDARSASSLCCGAHSDVRQSHGGAHPGMHITTCEHTCSEPMIAASSDPAASALFASRSSSNSCARRIRICISIPARIRICIRQHAGKHTNITACARIRICKRQRAGVCKGMRAFGYSYRHARAHLLPRAPERRDRRHLRAAAFGNE